MADEEAKLAMAETRLDLAEVEGAQEAAAEAAKNQALSPMNLNEWGDPDYVPGEGITIRQPIDLSFLL